MSLTDYVYLTHGTDDTFVTLDDGAFVIEGEYLAVSNPMPLEAWFPFVLPFVPMCPEATVLHEIRQAAIEFCARTLAWQGTLVPVVSQVGEDTYSFPLPAEAAVVKLLTFKVDGVESTVLTADRGRKLAGYAVATAAYTPDRINAVVVPAPTKAGLQYTFHVALKPAQTALVVPGDLFEHYAKEIADGALAALFGMEDVSWANPVQAAVRAEKFAQAKSRVAAAVSKGFSRGARQVRPFNF